MAHVTFNPMRLLRWFLFGFLLGPRFGFADSESSTATTQIDRRLTSGDGSVQVSGDSNNVSITDAGATKAALSLAAFTTYLGIASAEKHEENTRAVFGQALDNTRSTFTQALNGVDKAYEISRAGDQREVSMVVAVAIALAAAATLTAIFGNKKG